MYCSVISNMLFNCENLIIQLDLSIFKIKINNKKHKLIFDKYVNVRNITDILYVKVFKKRVIL